MRNESYLRIKRLGATVGTIKFHGVRGASCYDSPHLFDCEEVPWRHWFHRNTARGSLDPRLNSRGRACVFEDTASIDEARTVGGIRLTIQWHTQSSRETISDSSPIDLSRSDSPARLFPSQRYVSGFVSP